MTTKLTLTLEQHIIEKAKVFAKKKGRSLSDIVENYLKVVITEEKDVETKISPLAKSLKGSFSNPSNYNYKEQLADRLVEKYHK